MEMLRARGNTNGVVHVPNLSANNLMQKFFMTTSNHFAQKDSMYEYGEKNQQEAKKKEEEDEDVELTLGLSLNGQFGTDPRSRKRKNLELVRSSSIPEGFNFESHQRSVGFSDTLQIDRTRSLPVGTETKKKKTTFLDFQINPMTKEENRAQAETEKPRAFMEFHSPPKEDKDGLVMSGPVNGRGKMVSIMTKETKKDVVVVTGKEKARNILEDMPCVSTRDVGADGKRVEGFLYWYGGNKEAVKIVCVCHGSFLSPAEFVRHGGVTVSDDGVGDVNINPLRHIVVKLPSSSL